MQVEPIKPTLKAPGIKLLKLKYGKPLSNFAFKFNLRRYTKDKRARKAQDDDDDESDDDDDEEAGGLLRTSTRPTLNILLLRASVCAFTLKVSHAPISARVLVLNDPPARTRTTGRRRRRSSRRKRRRMMMRRRSGRGRRRKRRRGRRGRRRMRRRRRRSRFTHETQAVIIGPPGDHNART